MKVIFLDIDGVLNADDDFGGKSKPNPYVSSDDGNRYCGISKAKIRNLKYIIDKTGAKIVLVSSWKYDYVEYLRRHYNRVGKYLREKLRKQGIEIYDTTINYDFSHGENRGYEIRSWLENHSEVDNWVVLDDVKFKDYDFLRITQNLVQTDPALGLWSLPTHEAVYKLTGIKDNYLLTHERFISCVKNIVTATIPEIKEEELAIIKPEVLKNE